MADMNQELAKPRRRARASASATDAMDATGALSPLEVNGVNGAVGASPAPLVEGVEGNGAESVAPKRRRVTRAKAMGVESPAATTAGTLQPTLPADGMDGADGVSEAPVAPRRRAPRRLTRAVDTAVDTAENAPAGGAEATDIFAAPTAPTASVYEVAPRPTRRRVTRRVAAATPAAPETSQTSQATQEAFAPAAATAQGEVPAALPADWAADGGGAETIAATPVASDAPVTPPRRYGARPRGAYTPVRRSQGNAAPEGEGAQPTMDAQVDVRAQSSDSAPAPVAQNGQSNGQSNGQDGHEREGGRETRRELRQPQGVRSAQSGQRPVGVGRAPYNPGARNGSQRVSSVLPGMRTPQHPSHQHQPPQGAYPPPGYGNPNSEGVGQRGQYAQPYGRERAQDGRQGRQQGQSQGGYTTPRQSRDPRDPYAPTAGQGGRRSGATPADYPPAQSRQPRDRMYPQQAPYGSYPDGRDVRSRRNDQGDLYVNRADFAERRNTPLAPTNGRNQPTRGRAGRDVNRDLSQGGLYTTVPQQGGRYGSPQGGRGTQPSYARTVEARGVLFYQGHGATPAEVLDERTLQPVARLNLDDMRRWGLRAGDVIAGQAEERQGRRLFVSVETVNGAEAELARERPLFEQLTALFPDRRIRLEQGPRPISSRVIDLFAPLGFGSRALIVAPPKTGKTTLIREAAESVLAGYPDAVVMAVLVGERPEEVTDLRSRLEPHGGQVYAASFDEETERHAWLVQVAVERAKRVAESGRDAFMVLDSLTRLARAENLATRGNGRTLSGGIDAQALDTGRRAFGAARNLEEGGSITILATCLVDTGSRQDDVVYEEFKGTGNMELHLSRELSQRRLFPAVDAVKSGTRHEELLLSPEELRAATALRRRLADLPTQAATQQLLNVMERTPSNAALIQALEQSASATGVR